MNNVQVASNIWTGEQRMPLVQGNLLNLKDFGPGAEVYVLVESSGGFAALAPLSRVFVHVPGGNPKVKRSSKQKKTSKSNTKSPRVSNASPLLPNSRNPVMRSPKPNQSGNTLAPTRGRGDSIRQSFRASDVYARALEKLGDSNFKTVSEGLQELTGLVTTDSDIVVQKANTIVPILCRLTTHNNKSVSRATLTCLAAIYCSPSANLQAHLKEVIPALIRKTADKTKMLSNEAQNSVSTIISSVDTNSLKEMIVVLLRVAKEEKSALVIERATHYLRHTVDQITYQLINDPTTDTPLFQLLKAVSELMSGREPNTRKEAREIITLLGQEAVSQGSLKKFERTLEKNIPSKQLPKVMEVIKKLDSTEEDNYNFYSNSKASVVATMAAERATAPKTVKKKTKKPKTKKGKARVMEGVEAVYTNSEDLTIEGRPEDVFSKAVVAINAGPADWKRQFEALNEMRYLTLNHKQLIQPDLNSLVRSLLGNVGNLRSSIIKNALWCLKEMFGQFKSSMDKTLRYSVPVLVRRSTEKNPFLNKAGVECCEAMVEHCSPLKLMKELMINARQEKDTIIKGRALKFTCGSVQLLGDAILDGKNRNCLEDILVTIGPLTYNKNPITRETASNLAKIIIDYAISTGEVEVFRRIVAQCVDKKHAGKLDIMLEKKLAGGDNNTNSSAGSSKRNKKKKGKTRTKKKRLGSSRTSNTDKKKAGKGKKKEDPKEDPDVDRDDLLSDMFSKFTYDYDQTF